MLRSRILTIGGLLLSISLPAVCADIRYVPQRAIQKRLPDSAHIEIAGEITNADSQRLRKALAQAKAASPHSLIPIVILDSPGGSVPVALEMCRILRDSLAHTIVDRDGSCSSSCVFLLAGGVVRNVFMNGQIGLHRRGLTTNFMGVSRRIKRKLATTV